jgi:hypothetical protein
MATLWDELGQLRQYRGGTKCSADRLHLILIKLAAVIIVIIIVVVVV